jgi:hypothetical protein
LLFSKRNTCPFSDNPNNPCGFVYLRNDRVLEGENVYLEYYPSKDVMENPDNFRRDWWVRSKNGSTLYIKIGDDTYIEDDIENGKYTLTFSIDNSMNGNYGVYCGSEVEFTNNISVVGLGKYKGRHPYNNIIKIN